MKNNKDKLPLPKISYQLNNQDDNFTIAGDARQLILKNRIGINTTSIHSKIIIPEHLINEEKGSLELWFFSLEDLTPISRSDHMAMNNPFYWTYPLLSDYKNHNDRDSACFAMFFEQRWHPQFYVKMYKGDLSYRLEPPAKAFTTSEHMTFKKHMWYQIVFTWDKSKGLYRIYIDGVLTAAESQYDNKYYYDMCSSTLYTGNPSLCFSEINFYDTVINKSQACCLYRDAATDYDKEYIKSLEYTFEGKGRNNLNFKIDNTWQSKLSLSLKEKKQLDNFYVQGYTQAVSITDEGLLFDTPVVRQHSSTLEKQVYVWSKQNFEGDIYIEYEFKSLRHGGLSLLMIHACGMSREDFLKDYPLRTNGSMITVYGEDVRNYHWEYYREMNDTRNDVASSGLTKNPYEQPLSYGCLDAPLAHKQWHKLQYLQIDDKIIGALDGKIIIEATDSSTSNTGGVYNFGHIAIRCMVHTKLLVRNLKIYNKETAFRVLSEIDNKHE